MSTGSGSSAHGSPERPSAVRYWVLAMLCSLAFLTYLDRICVMRVQGEIERDLDLGRLTERDENRLREAGLAGNIQSRAKVSRDRATERMSWIFSAFLLGYMLCGVPGGRLGDRWGARVVIAGIVVWWSVFTALTGSVESVGKLLFREPGLPILLGGMVLVRFLFGCGEAGAYPNISRALGRWFPFRERASAQGAIWMASRCGGALAPSAIGALMAIAGGWHLAFWLLGLAGVLWAIFFHFWFRNRPEDKSSVNRAERELIRSAAPAEGSIYDDAVSARVPWLTLVRSANLWALCLVSFCLSFCWYFFVTFLPKFLKEQYQIDYANSEILTGLPLLAGGIACLAGGRISDHLIRRTHRQRWGRSLLGITGCSAAALCALAATQLRSPGVSIALICLAAAFQDVSLPCMWAVPVDIGGRYAGTVGGWMNSAGCLGGMLSPIVAAKVSSLSGWSAVFLLFAAVYVLGALAWWRVDASKPLVEHPVGTLA
jgi:ACS family glucarate transporter-like MFS transporter